MTNDPIVNRAQTVAADAKKAAVAAGTVIAEVVATGVFHGTVQSVLQAALAVLGVFGVYQVPNKPKV